MDKHLPAGAKAPAVPRSPLSPPRVTDYDNGISAIDADYLRPGLAAIHLIVEGGKAALVDTGTSSSVAGVMEVLRIKDLDAGDVAYVFVTHIHLDHAGGAGEFMHRFPHAKLVVHPRGARHMADPARLVASATTVYGEAEFKRMYGVIRPVEANRIIEAPDGFNLDFNGRPLLFLDTPGHARHHYCIFDRQSQSFFTGDTFGLSYREFDVEGMEFVFPTTTPVQFDPAAAHTSLDRIMSYDPAYAFLTHYGRISHLPHHAVEMHDLIDAHVAIARRLRNVPERHTALTEELGELLLQRIIAHGCKLTQEEIRNLLSLDVGLNAQGLEHWLDQASEGR
ncbi:Metallo-beta-lactamase superfamily protein [Nitrosospira sp. Nl5]|uniref:MBL fold metallo-hydrolase n=1 Tax=Nitrosospira sp. Nl5 TaxID=200120 RepID=UPI000887ADE0|nr:MBL fold metallo-hydrolase [Nitrosospira sp. Nl5]SCX86676.1 Metallo-beta-lactamase superfamily protein [Nitrosospira sp. Nl5]